MKRLITGGAGFIGVNLAEYFAKNHDDVILFDNLSRKGTFENVERLTSQFSNIKLVRGDIRHDNKLLLNEINKGVDVLYHLAAQVAVTTSVLNPREDFEINALGAFNVLEACRLSEKPPIVFYSSTNKVYGGMENIKIVDRGMQYDYENFPNGIEESSLLDFHSPYGCSKGSADQYFRDYSRIYGLRTVVFRQSCIYGEYQYGIEDQGWVAWFTIAAILNKKITIYGDGRQVRDVLNIKDLVCAFDLATRQIEKTSGKIYNIGGGRKFTLSLLELLDILEKHLNIKIDYKFDEWRPADQKVYISNNTKANVEIGWEPIVAPEEGVLSLVDWVKRNIDTITQVLS